MDDLSAVSSSLEKRWIVHASEKAGVLEVAQENWYPFELDTTFTCAIENLPGDIEKYCLAAETDWKSTDPGKIMHLSHSTENPGEVVGKN